MLGQLRSIKKMNLASEIFTELLIYQLNVVAARGIEPLVYLHSISKVRKSVSLLMRN
jgi:hypothetical protein